MAQPEESTECKTISISEFASRAAEGETVEAPLNDGTVVALRLFSPPEDDLITVQKIMMKIVSVASAATAETEIAEDDATLAYELGIACVRACVRDDGGERIADMAVVNLFSKLPYKSPLMVRCQELCGVSMMIIPPLDTMAAAEAMGAEMKAAAETNPNRKARRAAKKKG